MNNWPDKNNNNDLHDALSYSIHELFKKQLESDLYFFNQIAGDNTPTKTIDDYLDEYNDYMTLYKMFDDPEYKDKANRTLNDLKELQAA